MFSCLDTEVHFASTILTKLRELKFLKYSDRKSAFKVLLLWFLHLFPITLQIRHFKMASALQRLKSLIARSLVIQIDGIKWFVEEFSDIIILSGETEKEVWRYLKVKPGDTFIDVGAHKGKYALRIARKVGHNGRVIALEPDPRNYEALLRSIVSNNFRNVIPLKIAAYGKAGKIMLSLCPFNSQLSSVEINWGDKVEVEAYPLDDIINQLRLTRVDYVKIDVEGAECEVLQGLEKTLRSMSPKIVIEVKWENFKKVDEFLKKFGYTGIPIENLQMKYDGYFYYFKKLNESKSVKVV